MEFDTDALTCDRSQSELKAFRLRNAGVVPPLAPVGGPLQLVHFVAVAFGSMLAVVTFVLPLAQSLDDHSVSPLSALVFSVWVIVVGVWICLECMMAARRRTARWRRLCVLTEFASANGLVYAPRVDFEEPQRVFYRQNGGLTTYDHFGGSEQLRDGAVLRLECGELVRSSGTGRGVGMSSYLMIDSGCRLPRASLQPHPVHLPLARYAAYQQQMIGAEFDERYHLFSDSPTSGVRVAREWGKQILAALAPAQFAPQIEIFDTFVVVYFPNALNPLSPATWVQYGAIVSAVERAMSKDLVLPNTTVNDSNSETTELGLKKNHAVLLFVLCTAAFVATIAVQLAGFMR